MTYSIFVVSVLGIWLVVSVLIVCHCPLVAGLKRSGYFKMLSGWRLFVGPGDGAVKSFAIFFRNRFEDGQLGPLELVTSGTWAWKPYSFLWAPEMVTASMLRRLVKAIRKQVARSRNDVAAVRASRPYQQLLHYVLCLPNPVAARSRQFLVVATYGERTQTPPTRVFTSDFHSL